MLYFHLYIRIGIRSFKIDFLTIYVYPLYTGIPSEKGKIMSSDMQMIIIHYVQSKQQLYLTYESQKLRFGCLVFSSIRIYSHIRRRVWACHEKADKRVICFVRKKNSEVVEELRWKSGKRTKDLLIFSLFEPLMLRTEK